MGGIASPPKITPAVRNDIHGFLSEGSKLVPVEILRVTDLTDFGGDLNCSEKIKKVKIQAAVNGRADFEFASIRKD
jgi:hypothetical protein